QAHVPALLRPSLSAVRGRRARPGLRRGDDSRGMAVLQPLRTLAKRALRGRCSRFVRASPDSANTATPGIQHTRVGLASFLRPERHATCRRRPLPRERFPGTTLMNHLPTHIEPVGPFPAEDVKEFFWDAAQATR